MIPKIGGKSPVHGLRPPAAAVTRRNRKRRALEVTDTTLWRLGGRTAA